MSAFGVIVEGKPPIFNPDTVADATHCIYRITNSGDSSFLVVFLTNSVPFPETHVARLFLAYQTESSSEKTLSWTPLGVIGVAKPSAIFRISSQSEKEGSNLLVGISVEVGDPATMANLQQNSAANLMKRATEASAGVVDKKVVATRVAQDFVTFAERYLAQHPVPPQACKEWIPTTVVDSWIKKITAT